MQEQELGLELKNRRESKGLSMEHVQQDTKIRSRYLEAIEAGNLSVLPGMVYARGFIKSYAEYLGLNGQELLEKHGLAAVVSQASDAAETSLRRTSRSSEKSAVASGARGFSGMRLLPQIIIGVAVLAVVTAGYAFLVNKGEQKTTKEPVQTESTDTAAKDVAPVKTETATPAPAPEPPKPQTVVQEAAKAQSRTTYLVTGAQSMTLELAATDSCWVQVVADGKTIETGIVKAGESRQWKADNSLSVLTGKSKFITLKVNDQPVPFEPQLRGYTYAFEKKS